MDETILAYFVNIRYPPVILNEGRRSEGPEKQSDELGHRVRPKA